jgi:transcriptional regulator with XRE-family HTH domain
MSRSPIPAKGAVALSGRTQRELAAKIHVNPNTFGRVLNGYVTPWPALRSRLADELGVPESELFPEAVERLVGERAAQGHGEGFSASAASALENIVGRRAAGAS